MMPSDDLASNMHDFAGVSVHTWAQNTHPSGVTAAHHGLTGSSASSTMEG